MRKGQLHALDSASSLKMAMADTCVDVQQKPTKSRMAIQRSFERVESCIRL